MSTPKNDKAEGLIIERPERQKPAQKVLFLFLTMIAWTLWVSLWLPLLTLIAWGLGLQDTYVKLGLNHPMMAAEHLDMVLEVGIVAAVSLGAWAAYNRFRFGNKQKRRGNRLVTLAEMAPVLNASVETARSLRAERRSVVHFTDDGQLYVTPENEPAG